MSTTTFLYIDRMERKTNRWDWSDNSNWTTMKIYFLTRFQSLEIETSIFPWQDSIHESFTSRCRGCVVVFKQNFPAWCRIEMKIFSLDLPLYSTYKYLYFYVSTRSDYLEKSKCVMWMETLKQKRAQNKDHRSSEFPSPKQSNKQHINRTINAMKAPLSKQ